MMNDPPEPIEPRPANAASESEAPASFNVPEHDLLRVIGRGSSGEVWLARNTLGTCRAVKIVPRRLFKQQRPYQNELNAILKFEPVSRAHDGLVDVLQVGCNEAEEYFYYVMELADDVAGGQEIDPANYLPRTLGYDKERLGRLPVEDCARYGAAIASAVNFLHQHGLMHRDLKPSNIIFVNGAPKLADIGLLTDVVGTASYSGTEGFMPPEGSGTVRADVYSLGKVLYEISTGKDRNDYPELPEDLLAGWEGPDMVRLNKIIVKACRAKPWERYQTAEEMVGALSSFKFAGERVRQRKRRQLLTRVSIIGGALIGAGLLGALLWRIVWLSNQTK